MKVYNIIGHFLSFSNIPFACLPLTPVIAAHWDFTVVKKVTGFELFLKLALMTSL